MKKKIFVAIALITSFGLGFAVNNLLSEKSGDKLPVKKATGIGGIFFKCKDPVKLKKWYQENLGLKTNQYGAVFEWRQGADTTKKGFTQWSPFKETTKYFEPSKKDFMINYRVENMDILVAQLKKNGVTIVDSVQSYSYGKFVHVLDPEGNNLELWEPNDVEYDKIGKQMNSPTTK